ncbi:MAG: hypothetical protein ACRDLB_14140, partial [Actinomycetota bacterium]
RSPAGHTRPLAAGARGPRDLEVPGTCGAGIGRAGVEISSMSTLRRIIAIVCTTLLVAAAPGAADDRDASDPPRTSGPLIGSPFGCEDAGDAEPGETVMQSCSWSYDLVPAESNAGEDFSVYWMQLEIDPGKGWCARDVFFELTAPSDGRIVSAVPAEGGKQIRNRASVTRLAVDAEGAAPVPGSVEQDVVLPKGRTKVSVSEEGYSYRWRGNSSDKIVVAIGIQMSHRRLPPAPIYSQAGATGFGISSCDPITIEMAEADRGGR